MRRYRRRLRQTQLGNWNDYHHHHVDDEQTRHHHRQQNRISRTALEVVIMSMN